MDEPANDRGSRHLPRPPSCWSTGTAKRRADELLADELLEEGDADGWAVWRRILVAIGELVRGRREGEALNQICRAQGRSERGRKLAAAVPMWYLKHLPTHRVQT
jgi:hypothetical protein